MPIFVTKRGTIAGVAGFNEICRENNIADPHRNAVFIFPSNHSHHTPGYSLYSRKPGDGLAEVAGQLGSQNPPIPTLGLPTTGIPLVNSDNDIPAIPRQAVADLWKAVGFGLNFVLPVREHANNTYFSHALENTRDEPGFFGGIELTANRVLGDYYVTQLQLLRRFMACRDEAEKQRFLNDPVNRIPDQIKAAYREGVAAQSQNPRPAWFTPSAIPAPQVTPNAAATPGTTSTNATTQPISSANTVTTAYKINFTQKNIVDIIKRVCGELSNTKVTSPTSVKVDGHNVVIIEKGFQFKKVTPEIIEMTVKAMAKVYEDQGVPAGQRVVKLTLSKENEHHRALYMAKMSQHGLTLAVEEVNRLQPARPADRAAESTPQATNGAATQTPSQQQPPMPDPNAPPVSSQSTSPGLGRR